MDKEVIKNATPEQFYENVSGRLYTLSLNQTGGMDCNMYCSIKDIEIKDQRITDLEAKLAEKDIEIERLKQNYDEVWEDTYFSVKEDFELNNNCNECRRYYAEEFNKQLTEKAIAELEKVKKFFCQDKEDEEDEREYFAGVIQIANFIDYEISKLKGGI